MEIQAAIDAGVKLLNAHTPHWFNLIDLSTLDLSICSDCLMGQIFPNSSWEEALDLVGVTQTDDPLQPNNADYFGFDTDDDVGDYGYPELTAAWVAEIETQRDKAAEPAYFG